ncbi:hypothetical protein BH23PLA1_BH23PLA1_18500 [soil metagenome]
MIGESSPLVVVKVGGSLLDWSELPERLGAYLARRSQDRLILIVGGGPAADLIRRLDDRHRLGDDRAHDLALRALDLTAHVLTALLSDLVVVDRVERIEAIQRSERVPVLAPRLWLDEDDRRSPEPLPHCWEVTTDAIAARLSARLEASELVLLKSAPIPVGADLDTAARLGLVDPTFPNEARALPLVTYLNLRDANASTAWLSRSRSGNDPADP